MGTVFGLGTTFIAGKAWTASTQMIGNTMGRLKPVEPTHMFVEPIENFAAQFSAMETKWFQLVPGTERLVASEGPKISPITTRGWEHYKIQDRIVSLHPNGILFSQSSVKPTSTIVQDMTNRGWVGSHIDVVRLSDGQLVTLDNTRLLCASRADIEVKCVIRNYNESLSREMQLKFKTRANGAPLTWGEAMEFRINKQKLSYKAKNPQGSFITSAMD